MDRSHQTSKPTDCSHRGTTVDVAVPYKQYAHRRQENRKNVPAQDIVGVPKARHDPLSGGNGE
jgi:hypothetical protein